MTRTATIVGSGPNGLSAAVTLARAGYEVRVLEADATVGGGMRTAGGTLPGFRHDVCSIVHPGALTSRFFRALGLDRHVEWLTPEISYAHALDDGRAAVAWRDIERTADGLGRGGPGWLRMLRPLARHIDEVVAFTGDTLLRVPRHPVTTARFGFRAIDLLLGGRELRTDTARALMWGTMAHSNTLVPSLGSTGAGLLLAAQGHAGGWPVARGGSQTIADALVADLVAHGGRIETGHHVRDLDALDWGDPDAGDLLLLDTSPRLLLTAAGLPHRYDEAIRRFRYGPAVAKVDLALSAPVPWRNPHLAQAVTVHLGGTHRDVERSEREVSRGRVPAEPYVIVVQPSVIDPTRAPAGQATVWAYAHVPNGAPDDPAELVLRRLEPHAPGVRDLILASRAVPASERDALAPNEIGGDISGGEFTMRQALVRPVLSPRPWRTPLPGVYLCSASTPPGPAVHGMNGWHAASLALRDTTGERVGLEDLFAAS